jgi:MATE family multidrug resistance protein
MLSKIVRRDLSTIIHLAMPLAGSAIVQSSVGFFATVFLAKLGITEIAAGAVVSRLFAALMVIVWGLLAAVNILIAHQRGAKDQQAITLVLRDGLLLALLISTPAFLLFRNAAAILTWLGQPVAIVELSQQYLHSLSWSIWPDFINLVFLQYLIGQARVRAYTFFLLIAVPTNLLANYLLIFGKWGLPALGIAGLGWGTTISYWVCTTGMIIYLYWHREHKQHMQNIWQLNPPFYLAKIVKLGLPMGTMYCFEIMFFLTLTLLMGRISEQTLAANQITLQFVSQFSNITFAIAQAVTLHASHQVGAGALLTVKGARNAGMMIALIFTTITALIYWGIPTSLIRLDIDPRLLANQAIVIEAKTLFAIAAVFQIIEAFRIIIFSALQALKDTTYPLFISIISFWLIALPLGYIFANLFQWQGAGYWWAMVIGVGCSSLLLQLRFRYQLQQTLRQ